jgi:hypothetical protein
MNKKNGFLHFTIQLCISMVMLAVAYKIGDEISKNLRIIIEKKERL